MNHTQPLIPCPEPRGYAGNLGRLFAAHAQSERTAIVDLSNPAQPRPVSFRELDNQCNAVARGLTRAGLRAGDRIGILSLNRIEFAATLLGAMRAGVVPVPVNIKLAADTVHYILNDAGAKRVRACGGDGGVTEAATQPRLGEIERALGQVGARDARLDRRKHLQQ